MMRRWQGPALATLGFVWMTSCSCEREPGSDCPAVSPGAAGAAGSSALRLSDELREARNPTAARFLAPSTAELGAYGEWVGAVAKAAWSDTLPVSTPPSGFEGRLGDSGRLWVLRERSTAKRGAGFLVIRPSARSRLMIQAPHSFFDQGTLELALRLFDKTHAKALLINTMHRGGQGEADQRRKAALSGESEFDVAHTKASFFGTAHETLTAQEGRLLTLQLHGFSDSRAPDVDAIVSAATTSADAARFAAALREVFGNRAVRLYPEEIGILGGTTNTQARVSRKLGAGFIHLELSKSARERLRADPELQTALAGAILRVSEGQR